MSKYIEWSDFVAYFVPRYDPYHASLMPSASSSAAATDASGVSPTSAASSSVSSLQSMNGRASNSSPTTCTSAPHLLPSSSSSSLRQHLLPPPRGFSFVIPRFLAGLRCPYSDDFRFHASSAVRARLMHERKQREQREQQQKEKEKKTEKENESDHDHDKDEAEGVDKPTHGQTARQSHSHSCSHSRSSHGPYEDWTMALAYFEEQARAGHFAMQCVVNLTMQAHPHVKAHVEGHPLGLRYVHIPIEDYQPPTMEQCFFFCDVVDTFRFLRVDVEAKLASQSATNTTSSSPLPRDVHAAVAVHCAVGKGRTGTLLACYVTRDSRRQGASLSAAEAISFVREMRPGSIETPMQEEAVVTFERLDAEANPYFNSVPSHHPSLAPTTAGPVTASGLASESNEMTHGTIAATSSSSSSSLSSSSPSAVMVRQSTRDLARLSLAQQMSNSIGPGPQSVFTRSSEEAKRDGASEVSTSQDNAGGNRGSVRRPLSEDSRAKVIYGIGAEANNIALQMSPNLSPMMAPTLLPFLPLSANSAPSSSTSSSWPSATYGSAGTAGQVAGSLPSPLDMSSSPIADDKDQEMK